MTYEEAIKKAKDIPITEPKKIRAFVLSLEDQTLINQVCAKWFSILAREIKYKKEPEAPELYSQMLDALSKGNEVWKSYSKDPVIQMYMGSKKQINAENDGNYHRIKVAIDDLNEREVVANKELREKLLEFINGTTAERSRPFPGYEYYDRRDLEKYGIRPKGVVQADFKPVQGRDN